MHHNKSPSEIHQKIINHNLTTVIWPPHQDIKVKNACILSPYLLLLKAETFVKITEGKDNSNLKQGVLSSTDCSLSSVSVCSWLCCGLWRGQWKGFTALLWWKAKTFIQHCQPALQQACHGSQHVCSMWHMDDMIEEKTVTPRGTLLFIFLCCTWCLAVWWCFHESRSEVGPGRWSGSSSAGWCWQRVTAWSDAWHRHSFLWRSNKVFSFHCQQGLTYCSSVWSIAQQSVETFTDR